MPATIKIKNSSTASAVPTSSDLVQGELAVNVTDKRLFTENASGTVVELGTNPSILTLPDGSASAPTLTNDGDTNTGIFFPAADTVGISTGGTERARVDSSGYFGIGITSPAYRLDVSGDTNTVLRINGSNTSGLTFAEGGVNKQQIYMDNANLIFYDIASTTERMRLDASGNLLVGTTSATYSAGGRGLVEINGSSTSLLALKTGGSAAGYVYHDGTEMSVVNTKAGSLQLTTNGSERARIDSSGNLLVGTTSALATNTVARGGTGGYVYASNTTANGNEHFAFTNGGTVVGSITRNGGSAVNYNTTSDYRLKEITGPVTGTEAKNFIMALQPKQGTWKVDGSRFVGFVAHEFQQTSPSSVTGEKDAVDNDGNPILQAMQASSPEVMANLIAHIQNLETRLAALEQA